MKQLKLCLLLTLITALSAWSWPGTSKEKKASPVATKSIPSSSIPKSMLGESRIQPQVESKAQEKSDASGEKERSPESAVTQKEAVSPSVIVEAEEPPRMTVPIPANTKTPPLKAPSTSAPVVTGKNPMGAPMTSERVQQEFKRIMQYHEARQKQLELQMKSIRETIERARIYNKILAGMQSPKAKIVPLTDRAINQEKIRILHLEARKLAAPTVIAASTIPQIAKAPVGPAVPTLIQAAASQESVRPTTTAPPQTASASTAKQTV